MINAFHPAYIKTYAPEFLDTLQKESAAIESGKINGAKSKRTRESVHGKTVNTINFFPKTKDVNK